MKERIALLTELHEKLTVLYQIREEQRAVFDWAVQARPHQRVPLGDWRIWLILAGRGFGKTRTGAETLRLWVENKLCRRIALVGSTEEDVRQVMIEGASGLLNVYPPDEPGPTFWPSLGTVRWECGALATVFSAEAYQKLRGPQFDGAWVDELAKFRRPQETWDQLMLGLRLGLKPRAIVTTTPRPLDLIEQMLKDPMVMVTRGSTYDNAANLSPVFLEQILKRYENSALGAQEIYGDILSHTQGALWTRALFEYAQIPRDALKRVVIAVDPATSSHHASDETGIIVAGSGDNGLYYVLDDLSGVFTPHQWGEAVRSAYHRYRADRVVVEVNQGGEMIEYVIRQIDPTLNFKALHARKAKHIRAEPVAALYEQGKVKHVRSFRKLDDQLCHYVPVGPSKSPDRLDALVWAICELMGNDRRRAPKVWRVR